MFKILKINRGNASTMHLSPYLAEVEPVVVGRSERSEDAVAIAHALSTIWTLNKYQVVYGEDQVMCTYMDGIPQS